MPQSYRGTVPVLGIAGHQQLLAFRHGHELPLFPRPRSLPRLLGRHLVWPTSASWRPTASTPES